METKHEHLYALGDVVSMPLKLGKPLPKAGVFAHAEAEDVAKNIARTITRRGKPASFDGEGSCFIGTGDGKAGYGEGDFCAEPLPSSEDPNAGPPLARCQGPLRERDWLRRWV